MGRTEFPDPQGLRASLWLEQQQLFIESEMALFFECRLKCAQNMLDPADIVREAIYRQPSAQPHRLNPILVCMSNENHNVTMVPFSYGDFWDVPRLIVLKYKGHIIMLGSYFDEKEDEYGDSYSIFLLPSSTKPEMSKSLYEGKVDAKLIGSVPIKSVVFDATKRYELNPEFLDEYLAGRSGVNE